MQILSNRVPTTLCLAALAALSITGCGGSEPESVDVDVPAADGADAPRVEQPGGNDAEPVTVPTPDGQDAMSATADGMPQSENPAAVARAELEPTEGNEARGTLEFSTEAGAVEIRGELKGVFPAGEHGLHIHEIGDCSAPDATSAGGHFAPDGDPHGSPDDPPDQNHVGDLGNITADEQGFAIVYVTDAEMTLDRGPKGVIGRAVVLHSGPDDFKSQPSGAAGSRIACGVIEAMPRVEVAETDTP